MERGRKVVSCCELCAKEDESCCSSPFNKEAHEDDSDGIALTLSEVLRISEATGKDPDEFCQVRKMSDAYYLDADEIATSMAPNNLSIEFKAKNGACPFLGKKSCTIFSIRPIICQLYPFWFTVKSNGVIQLWKNRTDSLEEEGCVLHRQTWHERSVKKCVEAMGENYDDLKKAIRVFLKELDAMNTIADLIGKKPLRTIVRENKKLLSSAGKEFYSGRICREHGKAS